MGLIPNVFERIDVDRSYSISKEELQETVTKAMLGSGQSAYEAPEKIAEFRVQAIAALKAQDRNGDGALSWEEFRGPKGKAPRTGTALETYRGAGATHHEL